MGKKLVTGGGSCNFLMTLQKIPPAPPPPPPYLVKNERSLRSTEKLKKKKVWKNNFTKCNTVTVQGIILYFNREKAEGLFRVGVSQILCLQKACFLKMFIMHPRIF